MSNVNAFCPMETHLADPANLLAFPQIMRQYKHWSQSAEIRSSYVYILGKGWELRLKSWIYTVKAQSSNRFKLKLEIPRSLN